MQDPSPYAISHQWGMGSHWDLLMCMKCKTRTVTGWTQCLELQDEQGQQNEVTSASSENLLLSSSLRLLETGSQLWYGQCRAKEHALKCGSFFNSHTSWNAMETVVSLVCISLKQNHSATQPNFTFSTCLSLLSYTSYVFHLFRESIWKKWWLLKILISTYRICMHFYQVLPIILWHTNITPISRLSARASIQITCQEMTANKSRNDCQQVPSCPFKVTILLMLINVTCSLPAESGQYTHAKKEFYVVSFAAVSTGDLQISRQIVVRTSTFSVHRKQYLHLNIQHIFKENWGIK